jgi:hypothetical protein
MSSGAENDENSSNHATSVDDISSLRVEDETSNVTASIEQLFRRASLLQRVHALTAIIYACNPYELRFASAIVEELCSIDAPALSQDTDIANSYTRLSQEVNHREAHDVAHKLASLVPLISRSNSETAAFMAQLLLQPKVAHQNSTSGVSSSSTLCEECQYTMTMCLCHPAFSTAERYRIYRELQAVQMSDESSRVISRTASLSERRNTITSREAKLRTTEMSINAATIIEATLTPTREYGSESSDFYS